MPVPLANATFDERISTPAIFLESEKIPTVTCASIHRFDALMRKTERVLEGRLTTYISCGGIYGISSA